MMAVTETPPGSPLPPDPEAYDSPRAVRAREKGLQAPYIAGGIDLWSQERDPAVPRY